MILSEAVKPISYLKAHASQVIRDVAEDKKNSYNYPQWWGKSSSTGCKGLWKHSREYCFAKTIGFKW